MTTAEITRVFGELRAGLTPLIREMVESGRTPDTSWQSLPLPVEAQAAFGRDVVRRMGFDLEGGRLDVSTHPFCSGVGPGDTRLTTRYDETQFAARSTPPCTRRARPLRAAAAQDGALRTAAGGRRQHGIHESQSRLWENFVGRSRPFWEWALPACSETFALPALRALDVDTVYRGMNVVEPNLIRIESDEATYNLHIMLRFDLERALLSGDLAVNDLPAAWNDRVRDDLGLEVPDDRRGALQDIHWSMGAIGYFPTYTLGNLYAAQLWATIGDALPALDDQIRRGEFRPLLDWLVEHVHAHGRRFSAPELCERITGQPLSHQPLLDYLGGKLRSVYG
jgi:carboxypeptidase Taq